MAHTIHTIDIHILHIPIQPARAKICIRNSIHRDVAAVVYFVRVLIIRASRIKNRKTRATKNSIHKKQQQRYRNGCVTMARQYQTVMHKNQKSKSAFPSAPGLIFIGSLAQVPSPNDFRLNKILRGDSERIYARRRVENNWRRRQPERQRHWFFIRIWSALFEPCAPKYRLEFNENGMKKLTH